MRIYSADEMSLVKRQIVDGNCGDIDFQLMLDVEENMVSVFITVGTLISSFMLHFIWVFTVCQSSLVCILGIDRKYLTLGSLMTFLSGLMQLTWKGSLCISRGL